MSNFYEVFFYIFCGFAQITAGDLKVPIEGPVPLDAPPMENIFVLNASTLPYLIVILVSTF